MQKGGRKHRPGDVDPKDPYKSLDGAFTKEFLSSFCQKCDAWNGPLGLEFLMDCERPEGVLCSACYLCHIVQVFRDMRRVLRDDGTVWWNCGDSYAGSIGTGKWGIERNYMDGMDAVQKAVPSREAPWLKNKDQCLIPQRTQIALQKDGWYARSTSIWNKTSPLPENVTDRPSDDFEFVFLFTKKPHYFYDYLSVLQPLASINKAELSNAEKEAMAFWESQAGKDESKGVLVVEPGKAVIGRNLRSVWSIPNARVTESHTAAFPDSLVKICVLAGTPERSCIECGTPWERDIEKVKEKIEYPPRYEAGIPGEGPRRGLCSGPVSPKPRKRIYRGWIPWCECWKGDPDEAPWTPPTVLDPFAGTGTTLRVAESLGRGWTGIEISKEYYAMIEKQMSQRNLF
jgi:DNA modification methylase